MGFGGECHAPAALPLWKSSGPLCKGVRVGLRACLYGYGEEKHLLPHRDSNTDRASSSESLYGPPNR